MIFDTVLGDIYRTKNGEYIALYETGRGIGKPAFDIRTNICRPYDTSPLPDPEDPWDIAINALTCMILCHASAGIDVLSDAYKCGVKNAVEELSNRYGDL